MAWRKKADPFPDALREFREAEWPPVEGECLGHYACRALGYALACTPVPGEPCGQRCYEMLAREYPARPEVLAAAKRGDAYERFHQARLAFLGEDDPGWLDEFINGFQAEDRIRYAPFRDA